MSSREVCEFTYKGVSFSVIQGNIIDEIVDVGVSPSNEGLSPGPGAAGAIMLKAGYEIVNECKEYIENNGRVSTTNIIKTSAGGLPWKAIFHAVGPVYRTGNNWEEKSLEITILNCFLEASKINACSMVMPAISAGNFGFPKKLCAKIIIKTAKNWADTCNQRQNTLKVIRFIGLNFEIVHAFDSELQEFRSNPSGYGKNEKKEIEGTKGGEQSYRTKCCEIF
ncbi:hypothetical protein SteCoe_29898 [Stentor coeruleus]|uniref:Macro domain-containing protein n=1 Tax=Stentor coeruleus TaxID=5963 RepID=A0A1R2B4Y5_9CILI|nr:hypothetical protein SteCoe_29898 [Stentor coeruleus]